MELNELRNLTALYKNIKAIQASSKKLAKYMDENTGQKDSSNFDVDFIEHESKNIYISIRSHLKMFKEFIENEESRRLNQAKISQKKDHIEKLLGKLEILSASDVTNEKNKK